MVATGSTSVTIRTREDMNRSGTVVATLTDSDSFTASAVNIFIASATTVLTANTDYFLEIEAKKDFRVAITLSDDQTGATDWSIQDSGLSNSDGSWSSDTRSLMVAINGAANRVVQGVAVSKEEMAARESAPANTETDTVVLNSRPSADVTIAVASKETDVATVDASSLTFTSTKPTGTNTRR